MSWKVVVISLFIDVATSNCPNGCTCHLQTIDCASKHLTTVPHDLPNEFLQAGTFGKPFLPDMTTATFIGLNLANNQLEELPTTLLSEKLPYLQSLDLSSNKIAVTTGIQSVVFSKQLFYLRLSSNPIRNLGFNVETVLYSQSISLLDISGCNINAITYPATFMYLLNLTNLDLSSNPLFVIDHLHSSTLSHLDLSQCLLGLNEKGIREETFTNVPKLQILNVSMNAHLTRFPLSRPLSSSVLYLEASYCALEKMDLRSFPNLHHAKLKGNVIKTLYNGLLSENNLLQSVDVSENSIHHIEEHAFTGCSSLKKLDLSLNLLSTLNWNVFLQTPQLATLNISRNLFTSLNAIQVPSLTTLDASKCDILRLSPNFLAGTPELKYLNLSYNSIEKLSNRLLSRKLINLDLSFCRISDLQDETFHGLHSLETLSLMGNRLTSPLRESLLDNLVNMVEMNLLNNPWYCNCKDNDFRKLWKYLSTYPTKTKHLRTLTCHSPKEHSGMSWEKSCFENLTTGEQNFSKNGPWVSFLVPFLTLCCLLAIMIVIRQAYTYHAVELQQEASNQMANSNTPACRHFSPRIAPHYFDDDLERGIQQSVNESTQRFPVRELSKLPSYEEALLLPKLLNSEDLQKIITKYEESDRFERSTTEQSNQLEVSEEPINHPSTSRN